MKDKIMKKNSYIKILLLFIGVFVRLQASEGDSNLAVFTELFKKEGINFDSNKLQAFLESKKSEPIKADSDYSLILAEDFIKASFAFTDNPMKDLIQLNFLYENLIKLIKIGDPQIINRPAIDTFMNQEIDAFILKYPSFFENLQNVSQTLPQLGTIEANLNLSSFKELKDLLFENKKYKKIIAISTLTEKLNNINISKKNDNEIIADYLILKKSYDNILADYSEDPNINDLKKLFEASIKTYTDLEVVKDYQEYQEYQEKLDAFLQSPTLKDAIALGAIAKKNLAIKTELGQTTIQQTLLEKIDSSTLDNLDKLIIKNITLTNPRSDQEYAEAIESLLKKFDLRLNVSKVENFLKTGFLPKDRWFKNVFTKMKRAFGLSKDVDIVDVTNLLKNLNKSKLLNAQSPDAVTQELQAALLKDPALMYKLLPENAKYFIKQFDNIKDFKNKLLEAYYQDKVVNDAAFESSDYQVSKRAKASTNLIRKAIELGLSSNEREAIIVELKDTFPRAFRLSYDGFDLTASIVEGLKAGNVELPVNMLSYQQKQNQTSVPDGLGGLGGAGDRWLNSPGKFTVSRLQPIAADPGKGGGYEWPISENNDPVLGGFLSGDNSPALRLQTGADL